MSDAMQDLSSVDLALVVSRIPGDVVDLLRGDGRLMLAGGFIRAVIAGERPSDLDIFGPDEVQARTAAQRLASLYGVPIVATDNALTVAGPGFLPVQFILRWLSPSADALIGEFDFTIAQAAIRFIDSRFVGRCSPQFYPDLAARRLVYCSPETNRDPGASLLRMRKFLRRGYTIQPASLGRIIARIVRQIDANRCNLSDEADVARVVTALLYEIDPAVMPPVEKHP